MADLTRLPGVAEQIRLVAGLRWRLLHNNLRKKQNRLDLIGLVVVSLVAAIFVFGLCFAFYAATYSFLTTGKSAFVGLLFWAIFAWSQLFPVFVAGFGASFEFRTLLRFPMSPQAFYLIGLAYGFADFAALAALCWLLSMLAGGVASRAGVTTAMSVVILLFILLNLTLERLIGSWLERLLARRRTRELFFALFILLMISLQLTGPLLNRYGDTAAPWVLRLWPYLAPFPPSLAGSSIMAASMDDFGGMLLAMVGLCLYVATFSVLLWRRFTSQYRGEELREIAASERAVIQRTSKIATRGNRSAISVVSPQVAAVIQKEFRYLVRNGFAALLLLLPPIVVLVVISQPSLARFSKSINGATPDLFFPGLMAYIILLLMAPAYNSFAYESKGIQTYFMAPMRFREVFLGKNFVQVCLIITELLLCIVAFAYRVGLPSMPTFIATLVAVVFTVVGQISIANWSSLSFPRKLAFGQLHGQRQSGMAVLIAFCSQILLFGISSIILMLGRWTGDRWLPAEAFAVLAAAAIAGYGAALDALTQFAEKKKETLIEALCR